MKTLIELYDERPIENVLSPEVFKPERTVYLCPGEVVQGKVFQKTVQNFFRRRGINTETVFLESSLYNAAKLKRQLLSVLEQYDDCCLDITGGTDAALFAGGLMCAETGIPVFTYSRKRRRFYNIMNAPFADNLPCEVEYRVEDWFLMAGGAMRDGRVDNAILDRYMDLIDDFFALYLRYRGEWGHIVGYMQRASQADGGLSVDAPYTVKGEMGSRHTANEDALRELEKLGFIKNLDIETGSRVSFEFRDRQIRAWLRDMGSVLEVYVYKACLDSKLFNDVHTSAVVDWEGRFERDGVTNEIDVMATRGVTPLFISCKTSTISTEALNELAILRDRFGGRIARAAVVTTQRCRSVTRHRASELSIEIIDFDDLVDGKLSENIRSLMRGT